MTPSKMFRFLCSFVLPLSLSFLSQAAQAQPASSFSTQSTTISRPVVSARPADLNNDGLMDLVSITHDPSHSLAVNLASSGGLFRAAVFYTLPVSMNLQSLVTGDFNGDGKVDVVASVFTSNGSSLLFFAGNGDGTLQPYKTAYTLPGAQQSVGQLAVADFNHDGKLDVVMEGFSSANGTKTADTYYVLSGSGTGFFTSARTLYSVSSPAGYNNSLLSAVTGDFDGDANADIALISYSQTYIGEEVSSIIHVFYGNGAGAFTDTVPSNQPHNMGIYAGDLNSDSRTDLFGFDGAGHLATMYGGKARDFTAYYSLTPGGVSNLAMGDFNGDGLMDLVAIEISQNPTSASLIFYLSTETPGDFTQQTYSSFPQQTFNIGPVVGDFNGDGKPDVVDFVYNHDVNNNGAYSNLQIVDVLTTTASGSWGGCAFPKAAQGIHVCTPAPITNAPVAFYIAANSLGQLRKIELWIDGKKTAEQWHAWGSRAYFHADAPLAAGRHSATVYAADIDNRLQKTSFTFSVTASCTAPSSPGVHICAPAASSGVSSPVEVLASATVTGTLARMEVWVDGVKRFTDTGSPTLDTTVSLAPGTHRFGVFAVNTAGTTWQQAVYATVK